MSPDGTSSKFQSQLGKNLFQMLPEVYRTRDNTDRHTLGDLARYLDACGELLDLIKGTLDQRLADAFPDNPPAGRACQPWLLPYFAGLLDVRMVSPDEKGRRDEVANAVSWRQTKGTRTCVEKITESVGRMEAEISEGWQRTASTARVGMPLLPARSFGSSELFDQHGQHPNWACRHPGLKTPFLDFRYPTRAIRIGDENMVRPDNPAAKRTRFLDQLHWWRQANPHGAPCFPGSYEDVSQRTVDFRTPSWKQGHFHPKRILLHVPPPLGFFDPSLSEPDFKTTGDITLDDDVVHEISDTIIDGTLTVNAGSLMLSRCAIKSLEVDTGQGNGNGPIPVLIAEDSLFETVRVKGLARMIHCTVTESFQADRLQASDSIFTGSLALKNVPASAPHCIRYSRIPRGFSVGGMLSYQNTEARALYYIFEFETEESTENRNARFGEPGFGVLHPATHPAIRFGAEDGGEMGAYHQWRHSLLFEAVNDKLKNFLPVGMEAVLVPDTRLLSAPMACPEPEDEE